MAASTSSQNDELSDDCLSTRDSDTSFSLVEYYGFTASVCGYCRAHELDKNATEGRQSYGMKAFTLRAQDYQLMINHGWRRSGRYCYHPINHLICCPNYIIYCDSSKFKASRSMRRCIKNMNAYLVTGKFHYSREASERLVYRNSRDLELFVQSKVKTKCQYYSDNFERIETSKKSKDKKFVASCQRKMKLYNLTRDQAIAKIVEKNVRREAEANYVEDLEDCLFPELTNNDVQPKHRLKIQMLHVESDYCKSLRLEELRLAQSYQSTVHSDKDEWNMKRYCDFLVHSPIIIEALPDRDYVKDEDSTNDKLSKKIPLKREKIAAKKGETSDSNQSESKPRFLIDPPELPTAYGTYHCLYHLDDRLIAVGVIDVLPECLSTVYFFYDPQLSYLNLGIYSALLEISMIKRIAEHYSGPPGIPDPIVNYNMGFYVHVCKKMRYKIRFRPSFLLCSETCKYVPTETCLAKLAINKYSKFSDGPSVYEREPKLHEILSIPVMTPVSPSTSMRNYLIWLNNNLGPDCQKLFADYVSTYARLIGEALVPRLCLRVKTIHKVLLNRFRGMRESESEESDVDS